MIALRSKRVVLLPCPFCGKHPKLAGKTHLGTGVFCCVATCSIEEWNTRVPVCHTEELAASLEELLRELEGWGCDGAAVHRAYAVLGKLGD